MGRGRGRGMGRGRGVRMGVYLGMECVLLTGLLLFCHRARRVVVESIQSGNVYPTVGRIPPNPKVPEVRYGRNVPDPFLMSSLNTATIGRIE